MARIKPDNRESKMPPIWSRPWPYISSALLFSALGVGSYFASQSQWLPWYGGMAAYNGGIWCSVLFGASLLLTVSGSARSLLHSAYLTALKIWAWLARERSRAGEKDQWAILGYVRLLLAMVVMICHTDNILYSNTGGHWTGVLMPAGGFSAVLGFFIVSGYSIASSVEREKNYAYRRFWRIAPVYWSALAFCAIPILVSRQSEALTPNLWQVVVASLCLQNIAALPFDLFSQSWSLSCEVVYYTFAPLLRMLRSGWLCGLAALSIAAYVWHAQAHMVGYWAEMYGRGIGCLAWAWIAGFLAWRFRHRNALILLLPISTAWLTIYDGVSWEPLGWVIVLATSFVLALAPLVRVFRPIAVAGLFAGGVSYPLYLFHKQTLYLADKLLGPSISFVGSIEVVVGCLVVAILVYALLDSPLQRWARNRIKAQVQKPLASTITIPPVS